MGTVTDTSGNLALDPYHVAAWGGISVAGNIVGPLIAPLCVHGLCCTCYDHADWREALPIGLVAKLV